MTEKLIRSRYLQIVKGNGNYVIYHSLFGYPQVVSKEVIELLDFFLEPHCPDEQIIQATYSNSLEAIESLRKIYFLIPLGLNEREILKQKTAEYQADLIGGKYLEYLSLIISESCNFACSYCISNSMIAASQRKENKKRIMDWPTAKQAVDSFLEILLKNGKTEAYINFGGGEPLLNFGVIKSVVEYCQEYYSRKILFKFTINTNLSLLTKEMALFFRQYQIALAISLDGVGQANDLVRKYPDGTGTYVDIIRGIDLLREVNYPARGFSATVNEKNFSFINELISFAKFCSFHEIRIDLDVLHMLSIKVELAAEELLKFQAKAKKKDIIVTGFWERPRENLGFSILDKFIAFCGGAGGRSMCVSPNGKIYVCGYSAKAYAELKTISQDLQNREKYHKIISERLAGNIERCQGCVLEGCCIGGCFVTEEFSNLDEHSALEYNCRLYQLITQKLLLQEIS